MPWGTQQWGTTGWGTGGTGPAIRVYLPALYIDNLRIDNTADIAVINRVPADDEEHVLVTAPIQLWVVAMNGSALTDVTVHVDSGDGAVLAYDQNGGGIQAPFNGTDATVTFQQSPGSSVNDELVLYLVPTTSLPSLTNIAIEVRADAGAASTTEAYNFVTQDAEPPTVDEVLFLEPRIARLRINKPQPQADDELGGTRFLQTFSGAFDIVGPDTISIRNLTPLPQWVGYYLGMTGSAFPQNNGYFEVIDVDVTAKTLQLSVSKDLVSDDGIDKDDDGRTIRARSLRATLTSYRFEGRIEDEDDVVCTYEPIIVALEEPKDWQIPEDASIDKYVLAHLHDDVSYGRKYRVHTTRVQDALLNEADETSQHDFTSPTFGRPSNRVRLWDDLLPSPIQDEDGEYDDQLKKVVCVLQDLWDVMMQRVDQLQYLSDPDAAPARWLPYMLYSLANPFRFETDELEKRKLANVLTSIYQQIGIAKIIEETLLNFLGFEFTVRQFLTSEWWVLGTGVLGFTAILGPGDAYARNCYEILSPIVLTDAQRAKIVEIAEFLDPFNMHLIRIVEPGETPGTVSFWVLGGSALGLTTQVAPS